MDDGNDPVAERSEWNKGTTEELLAVDGENLQADLPQDGKESKPENSPAPERAILAAARMSGGDASETDEQCSSSNNCNSFVFGAGAPQSQYMFCGEEATNKRDTTMSSSPAAASSQRGHLLNVLTRSNAVGFPSLPDTSLEDGGCSSSQHFQSPVTGRSWQEKTPVDNVCEFSMQVPSPGMTIRIFLLERTYPERNEKSFFLYVIPEEKCEVYEDICRDFKEAAIHEGFSRQIPFTVNNGRSQDFHTVYIQERITVAFEIENRFRENFVAFNHRNESVFRVPIIKSDSQSRLAKGSKCQFMVQYVGEPGKPCQEQGKITLTIDSTDQTTMFFSISIWSLVDIRVGGDQPGEQ